MSREMLYHKLHPLGKVFDTEHGRPDPPIPPASDGWVDHPDKLNITTDMIVEAAVRQEFAKQVKERPEMEKEHEKKYGYAPRGMESDANVVKALDKPGRVPKKIRTVDKI